jgi:hypothetical protein
VSPLGVRTFCSEEGTRPIQKLSLLVGDELAFCVVVIVSGEEKYFYLFESGDGKVFFILCFYWRSEGSEKYFYSIFVFFGVNRGSDVASAHDLENGSRITAILHVNGGKCTTSGSRLYYLLGSYICNKYSIS